MNRQRTMNRIKQNGIQYTPPELASFLAERMLDTIGASTVISVLDPACGDGGLLWAFCNAIPLKNRKNLVLTGYETDSSALKVAKERLSKLGVLDIMLYEQDFLTADGVKQTNEGWLQFDSECQKVVEYDAIIANPPYVRTQTLGAKKAQDLAERFGITGRVDLYHAFAIAMSSVLKSDGVLGLLTSNRFLTVKSGQSLRRLLCQSFKIHGVYDLGDTKLFNAAVLPAIVIAKKGKPESQESSPFDRVYECRGKVCIEPDSELHSSVLSALSDRSVVGVVRTPDIFYKVERGTLRPDATGGAWSLATEASDTWLDKVLSQQACTFGDIANVKVGIKTTADDVFIRSDWNTMPPDIRPESFLIRPLITHFEAARWYAIPSDKVKQVLYPHETRNGKRKTIEISKYPIAASYLERHRSRLEGREYVISAGRRWYEIWVPHSPTDWSKSKIVWPDIAEENRFFLDNSGAIVNGDCYWITLKDSIASDWLLLMLAVANSTFILRFYDTVFHNKLYSGRRRFMTQYVSKFPLPDLNSAIAKQIVSLAKKLAEGQGNPSQLEKESNNLVWKSFGLVEEM
jgi:adenine-specific DNA-methyltransferase